MRLNFCLLALTLTLLIGAHPAVAERPLLIGGTVLLDPPLAAATEAALGELARSTGHSAERYAVTAIDDLGDFKLLSVAGLANLPESEQWYLAEHAVSLNLVLVERGTGGSLRSAAAGSTAFSELLQQVPDERLSLAAKQDLDPLSPQPRSAYYQLPWQPGTSMRFGVRGLHSAEWGGILPGWQAVDLVSSGNLGAGQAPNRLLAAGYGTRGYRCADDTSVAVVVGDFLYAHLLDNWQLQTPGAEFHVGDELGAMKTGDFDDRCGYAFQSPNSFHVHFGFADRSTLEIGSWLFDLDSEQWRHLSEGTVGVGGWLYNDGGQSDSSPPSGGFGYPTSGSIVSTSVINLSAWAWDDNGVRTVTFEGAWSGEWRTLHTEYHAPYTYYFDLCDWEVPDGAFQLNIEVVDYSGNRFKPALPIDVEKRVDCRPPAAPALQQPPSGADLSDDLEIVLQWQPQTAATDYLVEWWGGDGVAKQPCGWSSQTICALGRLPAGTNVSWRVKARNSVGESDWSDTDRFDVWSAIAITDKVTLDPAQPYALGPTTARFAIRNDGTTPATLKNLHVAVRADSCKAWHCDNSHDFEAVGDVTLQPGAAYHYQQQQRFAEAGDYHAFVAFQNSDGRWLYDAVQGNSATPFEVEPGIELVQPLQLNPSAPALDRPVDATFTVRNAGSQPLTLAGLGVAVRGPGCESWSCAQSADFEPLAATTLQPGQQLQYSGQRTFTTEGGGYLARVELAHVDGSRDHLGSTLNFAVADGLQIASGVVLDVATPTAGRSVEAAYTVHNGGDQTLTVDRLGVTIARADCEARSCMDEGSFATVGPFTLRPGQTVAYRADGVFNDSGSWTLEPAFREADGRWLPIANGRRHRVTVGAGLSIETALSLSPSDPLAGEQVAGQIVLRNDSSTTQRLARLYTVSGGPNCGDTGCSRQRESNVVSAIAIPPGAAYVYPIVQLYHEAGDGYFIQPYYEFEGEQTPVPVGRKVELTVGDGLQIESALAADPLDPLRQQRVTFFFSVANHGSRALMLPTLGFQIDGPGCPQAGCLLDAGTAPSIDPGESLTVVGHQRFAVVGDYTAHVLIGAGTSRQPLPAAGELGFVVKPVPDLPNKLYLPAIADR